MRRLHVPAICRSGQSGFSLLEVLVAFVVLALSLAVLYQAVGGSVRNVAEAERRAYALLLAQSLLSRHDSVPPGGISEGGQSGDGYVWSLLAVPERAGVAAADTGWPLYRVEITVAWQAGARPGSYRVATLLPERKPRDGERVR